MSYKNDNRILADILGVVREFLAQIAADQPGWKAVQGDQPRPLGWHDKLITVTHLYSGKIGWQGAEDVETELDEGRMVLTHIERWREEVRLQFSFFCNRKPGADTAATWTAEDMAKILLSYFDSTAGIAALCSKGYGKLRLGTIRVGRVLNSSENYQLVPSFDLALMLEQSLETETAATRVVSGTYHRV